MYQITKWCKSITDDGLDHTVCKKPKDLDFKFRLLDDDNVVYAYGYSDDCDSERAFDPLDYYEPRYGCTSIEYKNPVNGKWEQL